MYEYLPRGNNTDYATSYLANKTRRGDALLGFRLLTLQSALYRKVSLFLLQVDVG